MNTSHNKYDSIEKLIFDEGIKIQSLDFDLEKDLMTVSLNKNVTLVIRLSSYKTLSNANLNSLVQYKIIASGTGVHWSDLDEDLSLKGFLRDFLKQNISGNKKELVIA